VEVKMAVLVEETGIKAVALLLQPNAKDRLIASEEQ
jgi:hypothetical protein